MFLAQDSESQAERQLSNPFFAAHSSVTDGGTVPHPALGTSIFCQQHPAVRRTRDIQGTILNGGSERVLESLQPDLEGRDALPVYRSSFRRTTESTGKRGNGPFHLGAKTRDPPGETRLDEGTLMTLGQQLKTPKLRTDVLPHIQQGPPTQRQPLLSENHADRPFPTARQIFRVSGYSGGVSAINQTAIAAQLAPVHSHQAYAGSNSTANGKPVFNRPSRQLGARSMHTERKGALQNQDADASAEYFDESHGTKAALDSCRVPLDLASMKGDEDGIRLVNRSARALNSHRGEALEHESTRFAMVRTNENSNELVVCNSQKVEDTDLVFMSQFESGNLMSAQRTGPQEYDLQLQVDHATTGHTQWFFFCVSNTHPGVQYRFNIINFAKPDSLYTRGQQPLFFSLHASKKEKVGWRRFGKDIRYYRNGRKRNGKALFTLSFLVEFTYAKDKCLFAHCYPYTYTELQNYLNKVMLQPLGKVCVKSDVLCNTLGGNECVLLTITSALGSEEEHRDRKVIFVSSRVHPGESNSSWIMKGLLDYLLGPSEGAELLRSAYIFKIIPMLNPDGVINGHYRCNLAGYDLNRHWHDPNPNVHPTIFHAKELIRKTQENREVAMFCDIHGHSVKHNLFLYGCPRAHSVPSLEDTLAEFPNILDLTSSRFSMVDSRFVVEKLKEHTGRVVAWRELGIANSFTLEASLCGLGEGKSQCTAQFTCSDFEAMGREFGVSLALSSSKALYDRVKGAPELLQGLIRPEPADHSSVQGRDNTASEGAATEESISSARAHVTSTPEAPGNGAQADSAPASKHSQVGHDAQSELAQTATRLESAAKSNVEASPATDSSCKMATPLSPAALSVVASRVGSTTNPATIRGLTNASRTQLDVAPSVSMRSNAGVTALESRPPVTARSIMSKDSLATAILNPLTFRYKKSPVLEQESRWAADASNAPAANNSMALSEAESSSDDERHDDEGYEQHEPDSFAQADFPANVRNFQDNCKEIKKKVMYWGVMQQKRRKSLEARMRDLHVIAPGQKHDRLDLTALVGNAHGRAQQSARMTQLSISPRNFSPRDRGWDANPDNPRPSHPPKADSHRIVNSHFHLGSADHHLAQSGSAEFAPLARRQRFTTQRVQEKNLSIAPQMMASAYQPLAGFGSHKPVGPQCKFLPIMLGSLRTGQPASTSL